MAQHVYIIFILSSVLIPNEVLCTVNVCSIDYLSIVDCGFKKCLHSSIQYSIAPHCPSIELYIFIKQLEWSSRRSVKCWVEIVISMVSGDRHISGEGEGRLSYQWWVIMISGLVTPIESQWNPCPVWSRRAVETVTRKVWHWSTVCQFPLLWSQIWRSALSVCQWGLERREANTWHVMTTADTDCSYYPAWEWGELLSWPHTSNIITLTMRLRKVSTVILLRSCVTFCQISLSINLSINVKTDLNPFRV